MINFLKKNLNFVLLGIMWIFVWATYNTDIFRLLSPGFPHNFLDLLHGIRSFFPFVALFAAVFIIFKNNKINLGLFRGPLGFLLVYAIIGIIASFLSKEPWVSIYWGTLYASVIIILFSFNNYKNTLEKIVRINWIIAGLISIGLIFVFIAKSNFSLAGIFTQFLSGARPFEDLNNIVAESSVLGMAGSRPTGLGRYAGIAAIIAFANIWNPSRKIKALFVILFSFFSSLLIFSRARTSVLAFLCVLLIILFLKSKSKINFLFITASVLIILLPTNFYYISWGYLSQRDLTIEDNIVIQSPANINIPDDNINKINSLSPTLNVGNSQEISSANDKISVQSMVTLSGRTSGVWPEAWRLFLSSPYIGRGFQADRIFLNGQHTHNSILQALVQSGILGIIFFMAALVWTFILAIRLFLDNRQSIILIESLGIILFLFVRSITESFAYFSADWLFLAPLVAYLQYFPRNKKAETKMLFQGNKIDIVDIKSTMQKIAYWIREESQKMHWVIVTGMHGMVESEKHKDFKYIISNADMFVPDGISLVWLAKLKGFNIDKRVSGADLMAEFFRVAEKEGFSSYFYGDTEETLKGLKIELLKKYPNLKIAGSYSPPFRKLTDKEDAEAIERINAANPDVLWVALGLPKQERWIYHHKDQLKVPVVLGIGAALKFLSGNIARAPKWIGDAGFEWLWRLIKEPKTTWKRVTIDIPFFFYMVFVELTNLKRYK